MDDGDDNDDDDDVEVDVNTPYGENGDTDTDVVGCDDAVVAAPPNAGLSVLRVLLLCEEVKKDCWAAVVRLADEPAGRVQNKRRTDT